MVKRKIHDDFVKEVFDKFNGEITVLDDYFNNRTKIKVQHVKCGHIWSITPDRLINQESGCAKCKGVLKKTHEEFINEVNDLVSDEYKVLGKYVNTNTKIKIKHNKCGYEYDVTPASFLFGKRCSNCKGNLQKTTENFKNELFKLYGDEYSLIGEYKNSKTKLKIIHNICSFEYDVTPNKILSGCKCPKCYGHMKLSNDDFVERFKLATENDYKIISGKYTNNRSKIVFKHLDCNNEFEMTANNFLNGQRCPNCKKFKSKGIKLIEKWIIENNLIYKSEHRFKDCIYKLPLPFDFVIFNIQNEIVCLIEYDGEQHFKPIDVFGGEEGLKETEIRDEIKNKYCEQNDIKLIRIPYWEIKNISEMLDKEMIL
jgi:hypothetical protein